jgi:hypothetical protein
MSSASPGRPERLRAGTIERLLDDDADGADAARAGGISTVPADLVPPTTLLHAARKR